MSSSQSNRTMLVIDDDHLLAQSIALDFSEEPLEVQLAHSGEEGLKICARQQVDVVLLDQKLPDGQGVDLCSELLAYNDQTKIIFITGYPSFSHAVEAIKAGAHDYLSKPFELDELRLAVRRAMETIELERIKQVQSYKGAKEGEKTVLIGKRGGLEEIYRLAELASASDVPVLISGDTGVGKGVVAKTIHYLGALKKSDFISVNCGALPEHLIEAELFGNEKGAYTGAMAARKGLFEMAEGGTLFLDEICTLPWHLQSKLLGVLDDKKVRRIGGQSIRPINTRIITATNDDVEEAVRKKRFREDLYYRLSVIRIHVPPLRDRIQDIPELCDFFIRQRNRHQPLSIPQEEIAKLMNYNWPGNVRELKNVIERSIILKKSDTLYPSQCLGGFGLSTDFQKLDGADAGVHFQVNKLVTVDEMEKKYIQHILEVMSGNRTQTAQALGISRSTLIKKIKEN